MVTTRLKRNEKGVALLMVMIALLVFTVVTVEFVYSTRVHYMTALNLRDRLQSEYLARSGIQISLLVLRFQKQLDQVQSKVDGVTLVAQGPLYKQIPVDTRLLKLVASGAALPRPDGEEASVTALSSDIGMSEVEKRKLANFLDIPGDFFANIDDESGKINLNALANTSTPQAAGANSGATAAPTPTPTPSGNGESEGLTIAQLTVGQLEALFSAEKYDDIFKDRNSRAEVIYNLMDWVDADGDRASGSGAEYGVYTQYGPDFTVKNAPFDSLDEMAMVEGVNQDFIDTFRGALTVYGQDQKININTAPKIVLEGVVRSLLKLRGQDEIDQIVDWMDENRNFKDQSKFLEALEARFGFQVGDMDQNMLSSLSFKSTLFSVVSTGEVGGEASDAPPIQTTIRMVVSQSNSQNANETPSFPAGFRIVYWRVE